MKKNNIPTRIEHELLLTGLLLQGPVKNDKRASVKKAWQEFVDSGERLIKAEKKLIKLMQPRDKKK